MGQKTVAIYLDEVGNDWSLHLTGICWDGEGENEGDDKLPTKGDFAAAVAGINVCLRTAWKLRRGGDPEADQVTMETLG